MDTDVTLSATGNVLSFSDYGGIDNIKQAKNIAVKNNLFAGNRLYDYREFNTSIPLAKLEDEAQLLSKDSVGNVSEKIQVPIGEKFGNIYASRVEVSRAAVDAAAKVSNSDANAVRHMLGLPLQASTVRIDSAIWLPLLDLEDAIRAGTEPYLAKYGCHKPTAK